MEVNNLILIANISTLFIKRMASPFHLLAAIPPGLDLSVQAWDPRRIFAGTTLTYRLTLEIH
jgi:hypothetical protein